MEKMFFRINLVTFYLLAILLVLTFALKHQIEPVRNSSKLPIVKAQEITKSPLPSPSQIPEATTSAKTTLKEATIEAALLPQFYGRSINVPILMYHYIGNNPNPADKARDDLSVVPDKFDAEMGHLQSQGYTPITYDTLYQAIKTGSPLPSKPIVLTFDDGYEDFYFNAYPILKKYNFKVIAFLPTSLLNQGFYLNWGQVQEMNGSGLIDFEAHSDTHPNLTNLNISELKNQLQNSKKILEEHLGRPVNFMAYPYGSSNKYVWNATKEVGFLSAMGTWYGITESEGTIMDLPRVKISGYLSLDEFKQRFP